MDYFYGKVGIIWGVYCVVYYLHCLDKAGGETSDVIHIGVIEKFINTSAVVRVNLETQQALYTHGLFYHNNTRVI